MKTVAIVSQKGGSGKTTIAVHLAVCAELHKKRAAIIDLDGGGSVNTNIVGVEPKPENLKFGMKVKMFTEKVSEDREGNSYVAYRFTPA